MTKKVSAWDYGAFSPLWMTKALVAHLDRRSLNLAVYYLLEKADNDGELDASEIFQIIAQVGATNQYHDTFYPEMDDLEELGSEEDTPTGLPTKEEVDAWFSDHLIDKHLKSKNEEEEDDDDRSND